MVARYLNEADVATIADMPMAIRAVAAVHRRLSSAQAIDVPRSRTKVAPSMLHILAGAIPELAVFGYKAYTSSRGGVRFWVHLFAIDTGEPLAVIAAEQLGILRTGAASAVASQCCARQDAKILTVFGSGKQAHSHIIGQCLVLPQLQEIRVIARKFEKCRAFCQQMAELTGKNVVAIESTPSNVAAALANADVIGTVTTASQPLFTAESLKKGVHINAAGSNSLVRREIDEAVVKKMQAIIVDSRDTALTESGDLLPLLEKGYLDSRQLIELGDVLLGIRPGRSSEQDNTLFESQGLAIQDLALAAEIWAQAKSQNMGVALPY